MKKIILSILLLGPFVAMAQETKPLFSVKNNLGLETEPLVVVDDVVQKKVVWDRDSTLAVRSLNSINPNDIQSIQILKNESATKEYGEAGKNGVVVITTKKHFKKSKKG